MLAVFTMDLTFGISLLLATLAWVKPVKCVGNDGCVYNGKMYPTDSVIHESSCSSVVCTSDSRLIYWMKPDCPDVERTSLHQGLLSSVQRGGGDPAPCVYEGQTYQPGTIISWFYDDQFGYCYGRYCVGGDETVLWAEPNCSPDTRSYLRHVINSVEARVLLQLIHDKINQLDQQLKDVNRGNSDSDVKNDFLRLLSDLKPK